MNAPVIIAVLFAFFALDHAFASDCEDGLKAAREFSHHFRIVRTPRPGLEPAREIEIGFGEGKASITFAMRQPSMQISPLIIQIFADWPEPIAAKIAEVFQGTRIEVERFGFMRLSASPVHRDEIEAGTQRILKLLESSLGSHSNVYANVSRSTRNRPGVAIAARALVDFIVRRKLGNEADAEGILNVAHARLIKAMNQHQLRFFDYGIFNEVLPYEKRYANARTRQKHQPRFRFDRYRLSEHSRRDPSDVCRYCQRTSRY